MRISEMTWMQVEAYLREDDRCVLPTGSTEQHGYLSLATDSVLAERVATEAAEPLGIPVFPVLSYGLTPYFMAYPGTVSLSAATYEAVLVEILGGLTRHGFRKIVLVNGHGGNAAVSTAVRTWAEGVEGLQLRWHDWWRGPEVRAAVDAIDPDASHASWMESFPWTRVEGVTVPAVHKAPVDLTGRDRMSPERFREVTGDGSFGGDYQRGDDEMHAIWDIAVRETRSVMTGWSS